MPMLLTRALRRALEKRSFAMTTHRSRSEGPKTSRPHRRSEGKRMIVAYEDGEVMDDLQAFDREIAALDTLLVRLMQERLDTEGEDRCDLAAFTF
jgi:hypothetical protein